mmetsp:Transcript_20059/g.57588  ORF Transcript_20059/g.57588 Transcript_20059/m.57588 type:complete len:214 (-) Transcript_20059:685-1326(-)|eukprot:CAMPEP_0181051148 /NCGR_PEP_ID=MMETSP1070-20121207/16897_1 /TAXON_ID=265543 /ORGANISM="Minutocellus polymorphus, Strain NH13" /LENGTH=213 /DNA_ID=CAMNT_0023130145 /DNA_START=35 /DNA_END=676 /DNA_ORIENTATION=+
MTSINELFPKCRKLAYDSRQQMSQVQNGSMHASDLFFSLDELGRQLSIMEQLVVRETPAQREVWRRKILELREDAQSIRRQAQYYDRMVNTNQRQQREREDLMRRRRVRKNNYGGDVSQQDVNNLTDEASSLSQSQYMVGDLIGSGEASLIGLREQREKLRGVNRLLFDIGNKVGLSNATMRIIERRDVTDAYLVFAGMVVTLIVIYICWFKF